MPKSKTVYVCTECGADFPKAYGKCPACGAWNSFVEQTIKPETSTSKISHGFETSVSRKPQRVDQIKYEAEPRIDTHNTELNRVLGGGLVRGSLVLIGGEPGIGKSTLVLQVALKMAGKKILYASGEESASQLKMRAERIGKMESECFIYSETILENIFHEAKELMPDLLIIDSIQTIISEAVEMSAGSVTQVRECSCALLKFAKETGIPVFIIGHITKEGSIAGPKILEHIVDTVLQFEGDRHYIYRILRAHKNRFGSTDELAIYEMLGSGLREVTNPSELLLSHSDKELSGVATAVTIEGVRPFLIETQALVSSTAYNYPQRSATGFDLRRLNMLLAVLEKRAGFKLPQKDVFLNIAGGLRVADPAVDLAVICSVLSSNLDLNIDSKTCMTGEVGLSGEIRPVSRIEQRISEAEKLGFKHIILPAFNYEQLDLKKYKTIEIHPVRRVDEAFRKLFD